jgi:2-oxoglutarate ferredoxin oxidoreductase subunit beta
MMKWMKEESVVKKRADKLSEEELEGKIIVGEFQNKNELEFSEKVCQLLESKCTTGKPMVTKSAYQGE